MDKPFHIFKLDEKTVTEVINSPPEPHRHDHEELIIVTKGDYVHFIDFNKESMSAPAVVYVAQGKVHQFLPNANTRGWVIRFNTEFLPGTMFHFYSYYLDSIRYEINTDFCIDNLESLCSLMFSEFQQRPIDFNTIKHLLGALVSKLESLGKRNVLPDDNSNKSQLITFNNFLKILESNFRRDVGVDFYAEKMNMSVRNLNLISKNIIKKSITEIIDTRKLIEARQLLIDTNKSVSEIGYELGYAEKSYFTRVFRKKTGSTPSKFRSDMQSMLV
jgi:AraC family transcriptional regulator, transcriptional activator of pobA